jgi:hypothetical protein
MANKLARIAWAVLSTGEDYNPGALVPQPAQEEQGRKNSHNGVSPTW